MAIVDDLILTRQLLKAGYEYGDLRTMLRTDQLRRVWRGAYTGTAGGDWEAEHRLRVRAAMTAAESESVVSFASAALTRRLPVPWASARRVHVTKRRNSSGRIRPGLHVHVAPLSNAEIDFLDGISVTSLERTFVDVARTVPFVDAVALGDAALRAGLSTSMLAEQLEAASRRHGIRVARRAALFIDGRSESVGESRSRVLMLEHLLPLPELQVPIRSNGVVVGRVDFLWRAERLVGEFDGRIKYGRLLRAGEEAGDVVFREKQREDQIRDLGYRVIRWTWDDLGDPVRLAERIRRALTGRHPDLA